MLVYRSVPVYTNCFCFLFFSYEIFRLDFHWRVSHGEFHGTKRKHAKVLRYIHCHILLGPCRPGKWFFWPITSWDHHGRKSESIVNTLVSTDIYIYIYTYVFDKNLIRVILPSSPLLQQIYSQNCSMENNSFQSSESQTDLTQKSPEFQLLKNSISKLCRSMDPYPKNFRPNPWGHYWRKTRSKGGDWIWVMEGDESCIFWV